MRVFADVAELAKHVDRPLGVSEWTELSEEDLQEFGKLTADEHWVHVDPDRAAKEGPFGSVIAHGFLTLSLITGLGNQCYDVAAARRWINYGLDRVRFLRPLTPGTRFRLELTLDRVDVTGTGAKVALNCAVRGQDGSHFLAATWLVVIVEKEDVA